MTGAQVSNVLLMLNVAVLPINLLMTPVPTSLQHDVAINSPGCYHNWNDEYLP